MSSSMPDQGSGGIRRPDVSEADAVAIARDCYGLEAVARELGSNQDRNFVLECADGSRSVLRIDNPIFEDAAREAQHAALNAYRAAGISVPAVLPALGGELTARWRGLAVRRSEFAEGESMVGVGYLASPVLEEFGELAAASVNALADLQHPGLDRSHMWDMRVSYEQVVTLARSITDEVLRSRVLNAAEEAWNAISKVAAELPVQAIHGDLTDDNVTGLPGADGRLHPHTLLDLGDLSYGWRVAELAVNAAALLAHEPERPVRVLEVIVAFHRTAQLSTAEARAVWPLVVLRASILLASGQRQLELEEDNDYARERNAGERIIFEAANAISLVAATEMVLERLGYEGIADGPSLRPIDAIGEVVCSPLRSLIPALEGAVVVVDLGVESPDLDGGRWLDADIEASLVATALERASAAVLPYGAFRLTRSKPDSAESARVWPTETEIWLQPGAELTISSPVSGRVVAVAASDVCLELGTDWLLFIDGLTPSRDALAPLAAVAAGEPIGALEAASTPRSLSIRVSRIDCASARPGLVEADLVPAWSRLTHDPASLLGLQSHAQYDTAAEELARREQIFSAAQERYYDDPMQIQRGWRHHLVDATGRVYVDMVNNVAGVGHGHPAVAEAMNRQTRLLATNSRFLYRELADYSERLLATLPEGTNLDTVLLVNSGSEAVDLAIRLAQATTGRNTIVALAEAYHGWTVGTDAVTTNTYGLVETVGPRPDWVHIADIPNTYRGTYREDDAASRYAADFEADLGRLAAEGRDVAAFLCEPILGNAGGVLLPDGYLAEVYRRVREAGGLCIADEVQVGFGRSGAAFWAFELGGVAPDIVTIAKPMGNGFPIGGVITSRSLADALGASGAFFSSSGGNPVSCRVGMAVLETMEVEALQSNARRIGAHLEAGLCRLASKHDIVGRVHGTGLYLGVELVRDRMTLEPAKEEATAICDRLRELGIVMLATSERSNVLKIKPPMCITRESADFVVNALDRVLTEGW